MPKESAWQLASPHQARIFKWLAVEPTGKAIKITRVTIDRVADGRILEHGGVANMLKPSIGNVYGVGGLQVVGRGIRFSEKPAHGNALGIRFMGVDLWMLRGLFC